MLRPNDQKIHYKMYKQGKFWVLAGITALTWQIGQVTAHAATATTPTPVVTKPVAATSPTSAVTLRTTPVATNQANQPAAPQPDAPADHPKVPTQPATGAKQPDSKPTTPAPTDDNKPNNSTESQPNDPGKHGPDSTSDTQHSKQPTQANKPDQANTSGQDQTGSATNDGHTAPSNQPTQPQTTEPGKGGSDTTPAKKAAKHYADYDAKTNQANGIFGTSEWWLDQDNTLHIGEGELADTNGWKNFNPDVPESTPDFNRPWGISVNQIKFEGKVLAGKDSSALFSNLSSLTNIDNIDQLDTSQVQNMGHMFNSDDILPVLDISHFNTANVTNMYATFSNLSQLYELDLSQLDTSKVTDMSGLFSGDTSLSHLDLSHLDTHQVTNMTSMFYGDTNLIDLNLANLDTSHVTDMADMFAGLSNIRKLDVSHFDTSQVVDMMEMFKGVGYEPGEDDPDALTNGHPIDLDISNFDMSKVGYLDNFLNTMPKTLTLGPKSILKVTLAKQRDNNDPHLSIVQVAGLTTVPQHNQIFTDKWVDVKTGEVYTVEALMNLYPDKVGNGGPVATYRPQTNLEVHDHTIALGSTWQPQDNLTSVTDGDGSNVTFGSHPGLSVNTTDPETHLKLDPNTPGKYQVTYYFVNSYSEKASYRQAQVIVTGLTLNETTKRLVTTAPWEPLSNVKLAVDANGNTVTSTGVTATIVDKAGHTVTNFRVPGTYTVRYQLKGDAKTLVTMPLTVYSLATIKGQDSAITLESTWQPQDNFSAVDENGQTLTPTSTGVHLTTAPNTKIPGNYGVTYTYTDAANNVSQKTALVTVAGILLKQPQLQLVTTANWQPQANLLVAVNAAGKQLTISDLQVVVTAVNRQSGPATLTKPGTYLVTYQFSDKLGQHQAQTMVTVTSKATLKAKDQTLQVGDHWQAEAGFISATDEQGQVLPWSAIKVMGQVNTSQAGKYLVTYTYTDAAGNLTSQVTTVTVLAATTGGGDNGNGGNTNGGGDNGNQPGNPGDNNNNGSQPAPAQPKPQPAPAQPKPQPTPTETAPAVVTEAGSDEAGLTTTTMTPKPAMVTVASAPAHLQPVIPTKQTSPARLATLPQTDEMRPIGLSIMGVVGLALSSWLAVMALVKRRDNN